MTQATDASDTQSSWTDTLSISTRAAANLEDEYDTVDELITAYRNADDISDIPQVGSVTMRELREFIHSQDEDAKRVRDENDEAVCTEYTTPDRTEDEDNDTFYFSFICPRCDSPNPLKGDPNEFKNRPYNCTSCGWVSLLEANAIDRFLDTLE